MQRRHSARFFLPRVELPLVEKSMLRHGDEFLRRAAIVHVVRLAAAGHGHHRRVMPVVVPQRVDTLYVDESHVLWLVLRGDENLPAARRFVRALHDLPEDRVVGDRLRRIEPQSVEIKLVDPVRGVLREEFAHALRLVIQLVAPFVLAVGEIERREPAEITAVRTEMVVDDVEDHGESELMRRVDEAAEVVGRAVEMRRRPEIDAVVAPAERAGEFVHRHHFDDIDADVREQRQLLRGDGERAALRERADVHLVKASRLDSVPFAPRECRIDHLRRSMRPLGLKARSGIGEELIADFEAITRARFCIHESRKIPVLIPLELDLGAAFDHHRQRAVLRRPNAEVHTLIRQFGPNGISPEGGGHPAAAFKSAAMPRERAAWPPVEEAAAAWPPHSTYTVAAVPSAAGLFTAAFKSAGMPREGAAWPPVEEAAAAWPPHSTYTVAAVASADALITAAFKSAAMPREGAAWPPVEEAAAAWPPHSTYTVVASAGNSSASADALITAAMRTASCTCSSVSPPSSTASSCERMPISHPLIALPGRQISSKSGLFVAGFAIRCMRRRAGRSPYGAFPTMCRNR